MQTVESEGILTGGTEIDKRDVRRLAQWSAQVANYALGELSLDRRPITISILVRYITYKNHKNKLSGWLAHAPFRGVIQQHRLEPKPPFCLVQPYQEESGADWRANWALHWQAHVFVSAQQSTKYRQGNPRHT